MRLVFVIAVLAVCCACDRVDFIDIKPAEVTFKQPNDSVWLESKCLSRQNVWATRAMVSWSVVDPKVARVNDKGQLFAVAEGSTEVIARHRDVEARIPVRVILVDHVTVEPTQLTLKEGQESVPVKVTAYSKEGRVLSDRSHSLASANTKIAQIVGGGAILPLDPGETTVTVQVDGAKASVAVKVEKQ